MKHHRPLLARALATTTAALALAAALAAAGNANAAHAPDAADGVLALDASRFQRHASIKLATTGAGIETKTHTTHWTSPDAALATQVEIPAPATYRVLLETAALRDSALRVTFTATTAGNGTTAATTAGAGAAGAATLSAAIPKTGSYEKYRAVELGDIPLPAGDISIRISPETADAQWRPLDFHRLTLYPVAGAPGTLRAATRPAPAGAGFAMPGYYLWAPSVLKVGDTYHMFASRWPAASGMSGWLKHSECVRATSKNLLGPYVFQQVVLQGRPGKFDPTVHENKVVKVGKHFVHYYCAHAAHGTGIAWSENIEGPWQRSENAILPPPAVGPAVLVNPDNSIYVLTRKGGGADALKTAAGFRAKTFLSAHEPVAGGKNLLPAGHELEDPALWRAAGNIHLLTNDWRARVTGVSKDGLRYHSTDNGESYRLAERFAFDKTIPRAGAPAEKMRRVEHAFAYANEREEVTALFLSCLPQTGPSIITAQPVDNYTPANAAVAAVAAVAPAADDGRLAWFDEARFGLFIHWGVYSVPAGIWGEKNNYSEWIMQQAKIPANEYKKLGARFTAANYDPAQWARLARAAGMKYIVLTSKHEEGFCLWPTKTVAWNVTQTPAARDLVAPLAAAARAEGLRFGLYFPQSQDWTTPGGGKSNPDYRRQPGQPKHLPDGAGWCEEHKGSYENFLAGASLPQLAEILQNYQPDLLWWDMPVAMTPDRVRRFLDLAGKYPRLIQNNRLDYKTGDYQTPEQHIPATPTAGQRFEVCMTMNNSWGYVAPGATRDKWKTTEELLRVLTDTVSKGGNLLLNVGPRPDGTFPEKAVAILHEIAAWMRANSEAIHGAAASPFPRPFPWGRITQKNIGAGAGTRLYLHIWQWPKNNTITLPTLRQTPAKIAFLDASMSDSTAGVRAGAGAGGLTITLPPPPAPAPAVPVLALDFAAPPDITADAYLRPGAGGVFNLAPADADLHGRLRLTAGPAGDHISHWTDSRNHIAYRLRVPAPATCRVTAELAALRPAALRIGAGKNTLAARIPATGSYEKYTTIDLGEITLPAGETTLTLRPDEKTARWNPLNLRRLILTPKTTRP